MLKKTLNILSYPFKLFKRIFNAWPSPVRPRPRLTTQEPPTSSHVFLDDWFMVPNHIMEKWLQIPRNVRIRIVSNVNEQGRQEVLKRILLGRADFNQITSGTFTWNMTPEGVMYWSEVLRVDFSNPNWEDTFSHLLPSEQTGIEIKPEYYLKTHNIN